MTLWANTSKNWS
jgi:hypothetical protein